MIGFAALASSLAMTTAQAQTVVPELAPHVAKYQGSLASIEAQKAAAVGRLNQTYLAALDGAEKTTTVAGNLSAVVAIGKEREAVKSGTVEREFPAEFPKNLQEHKKAFLDEVDRVTADEISRKNAADAVYLRVLASLQQKAAGNSELLQQVMAEKEKLLGEIAASTVAIPAPFVGVWAISYDNGHARKIRISPSGVVTLLEVLGKTVAPVEMKIYKQGADFLMDWDNEDKVERLSMAAGRLRVEHFFPKSKYHNKAKPIIGTGKREGAK